MSRPKRYLERDAQIVAMRDAGAMPHEIAPTLGLTRNAVIGVLNRAGKCTPGLHVQIAPYNQARGERIGSAKLTESDVKWLRDARRGEVAVRAALLGISLSAACQVRSRKRWAHVA